MRKDKEVKQTVIVIFGNSTVDKTEPPPSWEDLQAFAESIEQPLPILWPYRRVPKKRLYKKWKLNASVLRRMVSYLQAGMPIEPGLAKAFYEVKRQEERARHALLGKTPLRKRGC